MIGVISGGDQRPGQQDASVPGARLPGNGACSLLCRRRRDRVPRVTAPRLFDVMLAGQARLATGSMRACHEAINGGEGLVQQWWVTQFKRLGIPGPPVRPRPIASTGIRSPGWSSAVSCAGGVVAGRGCRRSARTHGGQFLECGGGQHVRVRYLGHVGGRGAMIGNMESAVGSDAVAGGVAGAGAGGVVSRPRLFGRLAAPARVIVVSAPAGSGKTVLLRSWIGQAGVTGSAAWVPAGRGERDPQRFWLAVLAALRQTS